jgi:hypothetical protein
MSLYGSYGVNSGEKIAIILNATKIQIPIANVFFLSIFSYLYAWVYI